MWEQQIAVKSNSIKKIQVKLEKRVGLAWYPMGAKDQTNS
jgi:hypothetical protein